MKKEIEDKNSNKIEKILAFILGMIVCNNVIYLFKVGKTYINISFVYAFVLFAFLIIFRRQKIKQCIKEMNIYFKAFILVAVLSVIFAIFVFADDISLISSYLNGMIALGLCVFLYMDVLILKDYKKYIIKGLAVGFIFNILLSLVQYVTYNNGSYFSLYRYFPQPAFQINSYFGANNALQRSVETFNIYGYRAQGFFLETSYFMAFVTGTAIILAVTAKNNILKIFSILSLIFIIALTSSGNMIIILSTFILYYIMKRIKKGNESKEKKYKKTTIAYTFIIILVIGIFGVTNFSKIKNIISENNVYEKITNNIHTANIADEGNKGRFNSIKKSLALIPKYPFGVGYNMSPLLLKIEYQDGELERNTTYNRLITIQLEQGIIGTVLYLIYIYMISIKLILKARDKYTLAIGIAALGIFICQIGNGIGFFPFVILIFALANIESNQLRGNLSDEEKEKNENRNFNFS